MKTDDTSDPGHALRAALSRAATNDAGELPDPRTIWRRAHLDAMLSGEAAASRLAWLTDAPLAAVVAGGIWMGWRAAPWPALAERLGTALWPLSAPNAGLAAGSLATAAVLAGALYLAARVLEPV